MFNRQRPIFTQWTIREMIIDPRVMYGLGLIKGPLMSKAKFKVESDNEDVRQFVVDMINDFWQNGVGQALKAIEWGYSGSEVMYKQDEKTGRYTYCGLRDFESPSVKIVTKNGDRTGIIVDNFTTVKMTPGKAVYLGGPKCFHHVHWRHINPWYGRSRLIGAHIPWNEIWSEGGFRDIRRMWFYKNAFDGGTMYHPMGSYRDQSGALKTFQQLAQELIEKKRAGATMTLPSDTDSRGQRKWQHEPAKGNTIPQGLFEYGDSLRIEILEAMGIPYEVIEASGNEGFGSSSGRAIPETAFYAVLQEELNWLIYDFIQQIARPMVQINAALGLLPYDTFKVMSYPLDADPSSMDYPDAEETGSSEGSSNKAGNQTDPKAKEKQKVETPSESEDAQHQRRLAVAA